MEVKCACGMTNSCADRSGEACHFDDNDGIWREDSGYLTDKPTLPVKKLKFFFFNTKSSSLEIQEQTHVLTGRVTTHW